MALYSLLKCLSNDVYPGALRGFRIRAILSRNKIISITCPPRQLLTWEYHRQNRTIKLDFMRWSQQVLEHFWKSDQKSTLITGFWTCNEHGTSGGSKPVHIGDVCMGLISHLQYCTIQFSINWPPRSHTTILATYAPNPPSANHDFWISLALWYNLTATSKP